MRNKFVLLLQYSLSVVLLMACQPQGFVRGGGPSASLEEPSQTATREEKPRAVPQRENGPEVPDTPADREPTVKAEAEKPEQPDTKASDKALAQWCRAISERLFSVSTEHCQDRGFVDSGYRSVHNRIIAVRELPAEQQSQIGRVLLIGGTHGDELTSVSLSFWWLDMIEEAPRAIAWQVAPVMNPDGLLTEPAQRVNANNVDLNRNFPTQDWRTESRAYWQEVGKKPRRYPGETAASEPETRWLVNAVETFKPDVIVALHAPYGVLDYDGEYPPPLKLGELVLYRLGVFPGSLGNYGSRFLGIPVMTVELKHAIRMPSRE